MSEPQLERSVLEAKEREELFAIANALGTKPTSRARKSELVSQILRATGVEVVAAEPTERPRRSRARRDETAEANGRLPLDASMAETRAPETAAAATARAETRAPETAAAETARAETRAAETAAAETAAAEHAAGEPSAAGGVAPAASNGRLPRADTARTERTEDETAELAAPAAPPEQASRPSATAETPAPAAEHAGSEPGNRRSRRRRGRDRSERVERDLPGQAPEQAYSGEPGPVSGLLDLREEGYGFVRADGYLPGPRDVYVSISQVRRFALRRGDHLEGLARPAGGNEKYPALVRVDRVGGQSPDEARARPRFESLTPLFPDSRLRLERADEPGNLTARIIDLLAPIGKGQRGLVVSPPKAGKTTVLKQIARAIEANHPEVTLMVLLVDERPEEVTDIRRSVAGEVIASTFDRPAEEHTQVAELTIERAKRLVETGRDVVVVLDGITRLARAYNLAQPASGRVMSGGIDTAALYPPKKFFGAARNLEEGGSLTILATALVETGSKMDEVIFEEFKGTGNMELRLDRRLAERRVFPALDVNGSSTRHEELLFTRPQLQAVWKLRRVLNALAAESNNHAAGLELLLDRLGATRSNEELLAEIARNPSPGI
jgi:transcription termination factor Rho